jgi:RHS repeat-associated protein
LVGSADLVIRRVYARSPASAGIPGTFSRQFIEIYNRGAGGASLSGLTLQSASAEGSFLKIVALPAVWIAPGQTFLAASEQADQSPDFAIFSVPDLIWKVGGYVSQSSPNPPSATFLSLQGKVALVRQTGKPLLCGSSATPCSAAQKAKIVDLLGYGATQPFFEGTNPAPALTDTTALMRKQMGAQDTDDNAADFAVADPRAPVPTNMDGVPLPVAGAPALDATTGTTPAGISSFVYDSANPNAPQTGVTPGTIDPARAAWIVGYVKDGNGAANAGVTVSVVGHGQYGQSLTRADGRFDLIVNGSANFTLRFAKTGFFAADRRVYAGAQLTTSVDAVWLVAADSKATVLTAGSGFQIAAANPVAADTGGTARTAVLMVPGQTKFKKGSTYLGSMTLRLTEYTAGPNGPNRMPASLTGSPAYTYAVEISADEALGQNVDFTDSGGLNQQEVFFYVNDLVGFPVGSAVPAGYYDRARQAWVASKSGTVIQVVVANGVATVDVNGGGVDSAAVVAAFGIKPDELSALATQYGKAGQTTTTKLWRVPITHMTPYDFNWPALPPPCEGSVCPTPQGNPPPPPQPQCTGKCCGGADGDSQRTGSVIGCDSGTLGETVDVAGTPYSLNYSSYRTPGFAPKRQLKIDITGSEVLHTAQVLIGVDVAIAGKTYHRDFAPTQNLSWTFQWDGLDAAGRSVVGSAIANVKIRSYYRSAYAPVALFGDLPNPAVLATISPRAIVALERNFQAPLMGQVPAGGWSLGDWTLSPHHFYDVLGNTVHLGSGGRIPSALATSVISRIMGDGGSSAFAPDGTSATAAGSGFNLGGNPTGDGAVAVAPNGDVFMVDRSRNRVRRIDSAGRIWTVAGSGTPACQQNVSTPPVFANNGTDATLANVTEPSALAIGSDGSLYIGTTWERTIRKATPLGNGKYSISNFAGGSAVCSANVASTDNNAPATSATFKSIMSLAVGPDGSVFVADTSAQRIRRIDPAGMISTIAGNGTSGGPQRADEGKLATSVSVANVSDIAAGPDGTLYMAQPYNLLSVDKNGTLHFLNRAFSEATTLADGVPLTTQAIDSALESIAVTPSGLVMFNDNEWQRNQPSGFNKRAWLRVLAPSGIVTSLASTPDVVNGSSQPMPANGLALGNGPVSARGMAAAPNGDVVVMNHDSIYRISPARLPDTTNCSDPSVRYLVPYGDSGYCFDTNGRHKKTIDLHTGQALYTFGYNASGVLNSITDPGGRATTLYMTGSDFTVVAPPPGLSQQTKITVLNGHATSIADPVGSYQPIPLASGLLGALKDGEGKYFAFSFDNDGYLTADQSPLGTQTLERSRIPGGQKVVLTSPLSRKTIFQTVLDTANVLTHTTTFPDGTTEKKIKTPNGVDQKIGRDNTTTTVKTVVVSQLNGQVPLGASQSTSLPSGTTMKTLRTLSDPPGGPRVSTTTYDDGVSPALETTTNTYSATGQTIVTTSPENRTRTVKTDGTGHVTQRQIGTLTPTNFTYVNGRVSTVTQGARNTTYRYVTDTAPDDSGYLYQIQDPISTTEIRRDMRGRPLTVEAALGTPVASKTSYTWFKNDLVETVRSPERNADLTFRDHTFGYNGVGQIQQYLPPALASVAAPATNYTYTGDRDLFTEQPSGRQPITRTYIEPTGQLDIITLPWTSLLALAGTINYDYFATNNAATGAAAGRVSKITGPTAGNTLEFKYDGSLRTSQTWAGNVAGQVTWQYNNRFWPKQETLISGSTFNRFFGYDKDGLLACNSPTGCTPAGSDALKLTRSPIHGGVTLIDQGGTSGAQETWVYSDTVADQTATPQPRAFGELRQQLATVGGTAASNVVADLVYDAPGATISERRDHLGRIRFKTETFRGATGAHASVTNKFEYLYDEAGQLKSVNLWNTPIGNFPIYEASYDKNGNRKEFRTIPWEPFTSCVVDAQDRLQNCGSTTFTYFDNGEVKTKVNSSGTWTYAYDALGRLRRVAKSGGSTYDYIVDGEGRRIAKKVNGTIQKRWLYGTGLSPIAELDANGAVTARYVFASRSNTPDLVITGGKTYRLISDHLGSPRYAVNVANKDDVAYQVSYSPLGAATVEGGLASSTISWIPFGFAGGLYDPDTGLVHFGAREYDPEVGRWISKDPIRFDGGQTNLYVYVNNDPVNRRDPSGLAVWVCESLAENALLRFFNWNHMWLKTGTAEAGMGGNVWGTNLEDHSGDFYTPRERDGIMCEEREHVDEDCVNRALSGIGRQLGSWSLTNNCITFVEDVLAQCQTMSGSAPGPYDTHDIQRSSSL